MCGFYIRKITKGFIPIHHSVQLKKKYIYIYSIYIMEFIKEW